MKKHELLDLHQQLGSTLDDAIKELLSKTDLREDGSTEFILNTLKLLEDVNFRLKLINVLYESLDKKKGKEDKKSVVKRAGTHVAKDVGNFTSQVASGVGGIYTGKLERKAAYSVSNALDKLIKYQAYSPTRRVLKNTAIAKRVALIGTATLALITAAQAYKEYKVTKIKCLKYASKGKKDECMMIGIKAAEKYLSNKIFNCRGTDNPQECIKRFRKRMKIWNDRYKKVKIRSNIAKNAAITASHEIRLRRMK